MNSYQVISVFTGKHKTKLLVENKIDKDKFWGHKQYDAMVNSLGFHVNYLNAKSWLYNPVYLSFITCEMEKIALYTW